MNFGLTEEQEMIVATVRGFVEREIYPYEALVEREGRVPPELAAEIRAKTLALGFYACNFPESVGGVGLSHLDFALVERELGRGAMALTHFFGRPQNILMACTGEQVARYLKPAVRGERMDALAMTEPEAGSDIRSMRTTARRSGGDWVLNGTKHFISGAEHADFVIVFAATGADPEHPGRKAITAFLVDRGTPGFTIREGYRSVSHRGYPNSVLEFDDCRLPEAQVLGPVGGGWAVNVIEQCRRMGFAGPVWPVHPEKAEVCGLRAFPSVADLPAAPDAAFVGVNRHASIEVVRALAGRRAGGAVAFAAGWAEAGAADLQAELVAAAGAMPLLGPNCYGLLNYLDGAAIWPDQHGGRRVDRGVAVLSQSSNIAINLTMQRRGLPTAFVGCLGNAAQTGLVELGRALLGDPRVTALGAYVEGIADASGFAALAEAARAAGKGVAVLKAGRSAAGARAAASHTAALAGQGAVSSAFLAQCGVAEVATLEELVETLKILHRHGPLAGRRLAALSCSGGEAGLVADLAASLPLDLAPPAPATAARLSELLGSLVAVANPLDYHTFIWGNEAATAEVFTTMLAGHDAGLFVIDLPRADRCDPAGYDPALNAIARAARATGRPAFACATLPENLPEPLAETLMAEGIVPLMGLGTGLAALAAAATPAGRPDWRPLPARAEAAAVLRDEAAAKALLAGAGIAVPRGATAPTLPELIPLSAALTPPLALKGLGFLHKTEAGAVWPNLAPADLATAAPMHGATGYLAEEMITGTVAELLVGVRRDPVYGATLTLGFGGTAAELLADTVTLVLPVTAEEVAAALGRLRLAPLLAGHRGRPAADTAAAVDAALRLAGLMASRPEIVEIEINPLIVRTAGAVAADALVRMEET